MNRSSGSQRGASMVEFSIGAIVIIFILAFFIDAGFFLYRRATVTHAVAETTRRLVTELGHLSAQSPNKSCVELAEAARTSATLCTSANALMGPGTLAVIEVSPGLNLVPYPMLQLTLTNNSICIFCRFFLASSRSSSARFAIESKQSNCTAASGPVSQTC